MFYFLLKVFISALLIACISELSRRYTLWAALLASLPLTSILAFIWIYWETKDSEKIIELSYNIFWLVIPSLAFFLILPALLKQGMNFPFAMSISMVSMIAIYSAGIWLVKTFF